MRHRILSALLFSMVLLGHCIPVQAAFTQQGNKLVGTSGSNFASQGGSVALSADGNTMIVGGFGDNTNMGAAWVFTRTNGTWTQQGGKLVGTVPAAPAGVGGRAQRLSPGLMSR